MLNFGLILRVRFLFFLLALVHLPRLVGAQSPNLHIAHVQVEAHHNAKTIEVSGSSDASIFINNKLQWQGKMPKQFEVDSIGQTVGYPFLMTAVANRGEVALYFMQPDNSILKPFRANWPTISTIALFIGLLILYRTYPQITFDYFNVVKIFSIRAEEAGTMARMTSAGNIFFYAFLSALIALALQLVGLPLVKYPTVGWQLGLSIVVAFGFIAGKIVLIRMLAYFYGISDAAPNQFYQYVRLLLFIFLLGAMLLLIKFMMGYPAVHSRGVIGLFFVAMSLIFIPLAFLRLSRQSTFNVFHLFSYLCLSEVIPLIILLKLFS